jgi:hypothetical protein
MKIALVPGDLAGQVSMQMYLDNTLVAIQGFGNFPTDFRVILTGQARATSDTVSAVFDNVSVSQAPEPSSIVVLGAMMLAARRTRRHARA